MRLAKMLQAKAPPRTEFTPVDVPRTYLGFLEWLGVAPHPGQAEFIRVAYDGAEPVDRRLAERIFGPLEFGSLPLGARAVVAAVCGGRAGKTYLLIALRMVWGMLVRDLSSMAPGQRAVALVVAPNDKLRQEAVNYAVGAVRSKPELKQLLRVPRGTKDDDLVSEFGIYRQDFDRVVMFESGVATRGGYGGRGRALTDCALDECAFFRDASYKVNDADIFAAASPRVLPGGQTILASTPWAEAGLLYDFHKRNYGKPVDALSAHAPTLTLHDSELTRTIVGREKLRDPENARREFDAEFMTGGTTIFFEGSSLEGMLTSELFTVQKADVVGAGGDFAFRGDSSALLMVAMRGPMLHIFDGTEERPKPGEPLKPSQTVRRFVEVIGGRCDYVTADQHHRSSIEEHLLEHGLVYSPAPSTPAENYVRARQLLREGLVRVHTSNLPKELVERLVQQLRETQGRPTAGGGMSILHPRWAKGGHGDLADAFTLAIWQVCGNAVAAPKPELGTKDWEAQRREQRQKRMVDDTSSPADRGRRAYWRRAG